MATRKEAHRYLEKELASGFLYDSWRITGVAPPGYEARMADEDDCDLEEVRFKRFQLNEAYHDKHFIHPEQRCDAVAAELLDIQRLSVYRDMVTDPLADMPKDEALQLAYLGEMHKREGGAMFEFTGVLPQFTGGGRIRHKLPDGLDDTLELTWFSSWDLVEFGAQCRLRLSEYTLLIAYAAHLKRAKAVTLDRSGDKPFVVVKMDEVKY